MGKNTKYSKMQKMRQCERRQLGPWVCASGDFTVCVRSGCNFGAGTNEMHTEKGWEQQNIIPVKPFPQKTGISIKSMFSPKVSGFYPQTMTIHESKAERLKSSIIHENKKLPIWEMLERVSWEQLFF